MSGDLSSIMRLACALDARERHRDRAVIAILVVVVGGIAAFATAAFAGLL